jgi:hypothetical protein
MAARRKATRKTVRRRRNPVTEGRILDAIAEAVRRELMRPGDWRWTWDQLSKAERLAFDLFLVRTKDPLAWEPGTPESRFGGRVLRMAAQERERRGNPAGVLAQVGSSSYVLRFAGREIPGRSRKALESFAKVNGVAPLVFVDERSSPAIHQGPTFNPDYGSRAAGRDPIRGHQLKIARDTMRMHCAGARIMGGMDHPTAAALLGKPLPKGCTCAGRVANPMREPCPKGCGYQGTETKTATGVRLVCRRCGTAWVVHDRKRNPGSSSAAAAMFKKWHGFEPDEVVELPQLPPLDAGPLVFLGNLRRIDYDSPKWSKRAPGKRRQVGYYHKSTGRPYVMTNAAGNVLVIFDPSGQFKATAAGLVK